MAERTPVDSLVNQLHAFGKLSNYDDVRLKRGYRSLRAVSSFLSRSRRDGERAIRRQYNDILTKQFEIEIVQHMYSREGVELDRLDARRDETLKIVDECEQKDIISKYEIAELEQASLDFTGQAVEVRVRNASEVQPSLSILEDESLSIQQAWRQACDANDRDEARKYNLLNDLRRYDERNIQARLSLRRLGEVLRKLAYEPERFGKQAALVQRAKLKLEVEVVRVQQHSMSLDNARAHQLSRRRQADCIRNSLAHKLELHQDTIQHRNRDVETVTRCVGTEQTRSLQACETSVVLETTSKHVCERLQVESEKFSFSKKENSVLRHRLCKKTVLAESLRELVPAFKIRLSDIQQKLSYLVSTNANRLHDTTILRSEVDMAIAKLLLQDHAEKGKRQCLGLLLRDVARIEDDIATWSAEERRQGKLRAVLDSQRDGKAREVTRARAIELDMQERVRIKSLIILDFTKKFNEVSNRLKEFSALYDVVKSERNKYLNLIQSSSQALAEMKEKIKILMSEVEILRIESLTKEKALSKENAQHISSQAQRDGIRLELFKAQAEYCCKQLSTEQQIAEIRKLNSTISNLESSMLRYNHEFERIIGVRNCIGVMLIDRNDELCVLYEKIHLQSRALKEGELAVQKKHEDVHRLQLVLLGLQRQVVVCQRRMPAGSHLLKSVVDMKSTLCADRQQSLSLCLALESPANPTRWRGITGQDLTTDQLDYRLAVLQSQLNDAKDVFLEVRLLLEEVSNLLASMRQVVVCRRVSAQSMSTKLNAYHTRIMCTNRELCASGAEVSMHEALALNYHYQLRVAVMSRCKARGLAAQGRCPTARALNSLKRRGQLVQQTDVECSNSTMLDTVANLRPTAYIPDACLHIPKPYGALAPFRPTRAGSSMRHTVRPNPKTLLI